jgi:hypothetical protein
MSETRLQNHSEQQPYDIGHVGDVALGVALLDVTIDNTTRTTVGEINPGLLPGQEYASRRSETLLNNPEAVLDEQAEIETYFDRQAPVYVEEIKQLANLESPMKSANRIVVTIVGYGEDSRIKNTLEQYTKQDIDPNLYEIVMLDNHPKAVADDNTAEEVARFKEQHPEISITYAHKIWEEDEPATVGNARRYAFDIAQARILSRGSSDSDTILISNDADAFSIEQNYLSSILAEFETKPKEDALVTRMELPEEVLRKPNIAAAFLVLDGLERSIAKGDEGLGLEKEPAALIGRSSAMRASIYAAVGGFNARAVIAEDTELGWMISDAREWDPDRVVQFDGTSLTTDPRRHLDAIASRVPLDQMLYDFQERPGLRQMDNEEVLGLIPDYFDWELFQDEVDSAWHSQLGGNKRLGKRFEPIFESTMDKLGIDYEIVDGNVVLKDVSKLLDRLSIGEESIEVRHSQQREYTPQMVEQIQQFFSGVSRGVIEARNTPGRPNEHKVA